MQRLNVGQVERITSTRRPEQRRANLFSESRSDASYFFLAAGLAALGTGLLPVRLNIFVSIAADAS
jgi:hypothetical protein